MRQLYRKKASTFTASQKDRWHRNKACLWSACHKLPSDLLWPYWSSSPSSRKHTCAVCKTPVALSCLSKTALHPLLPEPLPHLCHIVSLDVSSLLHILLWGMTCFFKKKRHNVCIICDRSHQGNWEKFPHFSQNISNNFWSHSAVLIAFNIFFLYYQTKHLHN